MEGELALWFLLIDLVEQAAHKPVVQTSSHKRCQSLPLFTPPQWSYINRAPGSLSPTGSYFVCVRHP